MVSYADTKRLDVLPQVVIRWHPEDIFWDPKSLQLNCLDQKFQFLNLHAYGKTGCLLAHCFPPFSSGYGGLQTDEEVRCPQLGAALAVVMPLIASAMRGSCSVEV